MLIDKGLADRLILITRTPAKLADRSAQGCEVRYGDFDKPETLAEAVRGAEKMLLISGTRVGARVVQHKAAIDAAAAAGIAHILYTSFIGIDASDNPAEVRHDHIETETLMRASGMAWTMLRDAHYADAMILMAGPNVMATGQWFSNTGDGKEAMSGATTASRPRSRCSPRRAMRAGPTISPAPTCRASTRSPRSSAT